MRPYVNDHADSQSVQAQDRYWHISFNHWKWAESNVSKDSDTGYSTGYYGLQYIQSDAPLNLYNPSQETDSQDIIVR